MVTVTADDTTETKIFHARKRTAEELAKEGIEELKQTAMASCELCSQLKRLYWLG